MNEAASLAKAFHTALFGYAMMYAEKIENPTPLTHANMVAGKVKFSGFAEGELIVTVPVEFCALLASNVLGSETPQGPAAQCDSFREFLNILCGRFLTEIYGEEAVFTIFAPYSAPVLAKEEEVLMGTDFELYDVEGFRLKIRLNHKKGE